MVAELGVVERGAAVEIKMKKSANRMRAASLAAVFST